MVQSSVGVFWGAYGHLGELQVVYRIGGDSGGDGFFLPYIPIKIPAPVKPRQTRPSQRIFADFVWGEIAIANSYLYLGCGYIGKTMYG